jgi:hypothetical protein
MMINLDSICLAEEGAWVNLESCYMNNLSDVFNQAVLKIGMDKLELPIFYNAPNGVRFEIGGLEPIYLDTLSENLVSNPAYVDSAFERARAIYQGLPCEPNLLRIDGYPGEKDAQEIVDDVCRYTELPLPQEQVIKAIQDENDTEEHFNQLQLYWDLSAIKFQPDKLLREIIKGDIGGCMELVSSTYLVDSRNFVLFHLYDDRGLDVVAANKESLRPLYKNFNAWILDYDRERIDLVFKE